MRRVKCLQVLLFQCSLSEKRDSNPRPRPWQGRALPTELFSQFSLLANPLASLSCPVFVVCVAKVGIIFELTNLLAKKIHFALNFPLFFLFRLPPQPPQPRFHPISPPENTVTPLLISCHAKPTLPPQTRPSGATTRTPSPPPTRCADAPHADKHSHAAPRLHPHHPSLIAHHLHMPPLPRALQSPSGHLDISAARPDRFAPQGRTRPYPRAQPRRSAWGVGRGDVPYGKGAHRLVRPLIWVGLARMAPGIMSG